MRDSCVTLAKYCSVLCKEEDKHLLSSFPRALINLTVDKALNLVVGVREVS